MVRMDQCWMGIQFGIGNLFINNKGIIQGPPPSLTNKLSEFVDDWGYIKLLKIIDKLNHLAGHQCVIIMDPFLDADHQKNEGTNRIGA